MVARGARAAAGDAGDRIAKLFNGHRFAGAGPRISARAMRKRQPVVYAKVPERQPVVYMNICALLVIS